jgi:hypothetical protein
MPDAIQNQVGPRLSDEDFFNKLIDSSPDLKEIKEAAMQKKFRKARQKFAEHVRNSLKPENYFRIPDHELQNKFMFPEETQQEAANRILTLKLISVGVPYQFENRVNWFFNPTYNKYGEWVWQLNRHWEWEILARRYRETGDEQYAKGFINLFQSWVRQVIVPEKNPGWDTLGWRTIEAGLRMGNAWPYALHAFYRSPHFTDDVLIDWYKSLLEHGHRLRHFHMSKNWLIMEMNGLAHVSLLCPEFNDSIEWQSYALEKLTEELTVQLYPDGFQSELTTNYHEVVLQNYYQFLQLYEAYDIPFPSDIIRYLENACAVHIKMMMPDGRLPDLNDGNWLRVSSSASIHAALKYHPHREDFLWAATEGKMGRPPAEISADFPYAGYYVMRNSRNRDAVWALFDAGPFGTGHQHEDKLNFLVHAYGNLLLTEGGRYAYDNSEMRRYTISTRAHNTIRVDSSDQNRRPNYKWDPSDIQKLSGAQWHSRDRYDIAEGIYDEGYSSGADAVHQRKVIFLKEHPVLGPFFIIIDRLVNNDSLDHNYEILWHFESDSVAVNQLKVSSINPGGANIMILPSQVKSLYVDIIKGQEKLEWQGWKPIKQKNQGQYIPSPTAAYKFNSIHPIRVVTLIHPTKPGENSPISKVEALEQVQDKSIRITLENGKQLFINEADYDTYLKL